MADTVHPVQVGGPQQLQLTHLPTNAQCFIVSPVRPITGHYWMIDRINVTLPPTIAPYASGVPILCNLYHAPLGVTEIAASGLLQGINMINGIQGSDLVLVDSGAIAASGSTIPVPFLTADESKACYIPENRVPVMLIYGYSGGSSQPMMCYLQYTDWMFDVPKSSYLPVVEESNDTDE